MKTIYWISTLITCAFLLLSTYTYVFHKATIDGVKALGFPGFFRVQLAVLKIFAVIILLLPNLPIAMKEWAYAGILLFFITAFVAHVAHKDSIGISILLVVLSAIAITSYHTMKKMLN